MKTLELAAHWLFALFMAAVSYFGALLLLAFLLLKLEGIPIGTQPPPGFHSQLNPVLFGALAYAIMFLPLMAAVYVGAITAPHAQLKLAAIVFPILVWSAINLVTLLGRSARPIDWSFLLETGVSCTAVGGFILFRWVRQQAKRRVADRQPT